HHIHRLLISDPDAPLTRVRLERWASVRAVATPVLPNCNWNTVATALQIEDSDFVNPPITYSMPFSDAMPA
ncbi:MAG TPA: hypothetical protein VK141_03515, partial [Nitrosomonas sp.]|nr:hypothetical protein [Nitrosomonas sp.]